MFVCLLMKIWNQCPLGLCLVVVLRRSVGAAQKDSPPSPSTNVPPATLEALVADVVEHNPELNLYRAEIAAAKGERRTAATRANPEVATTLGQKSVRGSGLSAEGVAWSVSVQQTIEWPGRIPLRKATRWSAARSPTTPRLPATSRRRAHFSGRASWRLRDWPTSRRCAARPSRR